MISRIDGPIRHGRSAEYRMNDVELAQWKEGALLAQLRTLAEQFLGTVGSTVGIRVGVEEPLYSVQSLADGVEIRRYGPRIAAETTVVGDEEESETPASGGWPATSSAPTSGPIGSP